MEQNVGGLDRVLRLVAGPVLLAIGAAALLDLLSLDLLTVAIAVIFGLVFLLTGLSQQCIINDVLGVDTSK